MFIVPSVLFYALFILSLSVSLHIQNFVVLSFSMSFPNSGHFIAPSNRRIPFHYFEQIINLQVGVTWNLSIKTRNYFVLIAVHVITRFIISRFIQVWNIVPRWSNIFYLKLLDYFRNPNEIILRNSCQKLHQIRECVN